MHTPENSNSTQQSSKQNMQNENSIDLTTVRRFQQILGKVIYISHRDRDLKRHMPLTAWSKGSPGIGRKYESA